MQASNKRRVVLYSSAALLVSGLVYGGYVYKAPPTPGMLISSVDIQMSLGLFEEAAPFVEELLRQEPESLIGKAYWAAILEHRGDRQGALQTYKDLLPRTQDADLRTEFQIAVARLEVEEGDAAKALKTLEAVSHERVEFATKLDIVRARAYAQLGQVAAAEAAVVRLEEAGQGSWSSARLRSEIGLEPRSEATVEVDGKNSTTPIQAENQGGR